MSNKAARDIVDVDAIDELELLRIVGGGNKTGAAEAAEADATDGAPETLLLLLTMVVIGEVLVISDPCEVSSAFLFLVGVIAAEDA